MSLRHLFDGLRASGRPCLPLSAGDHAEQQRRGMALAQRESWIVAIDGHDGIDGFDPLVVRRILRAASAVAILSPVAFPEEMVEPVLADVRREDLPRWCFILTTVQHHLAWSQLADRYQVTAERLEGIAPEDAASWARTMARGARRV